MIVSSAPGRCGIVGNPTDIYGGAVLSISTVERATCRLSRSSRGRITSFGEISWLDSEGDLAPQADVMEIGRACLRFFRLDPVVYPLCVDLTTEIPMRAGMAGSTALVVALVGALNKMFDWRQHPWALAETARRVEADAMGVFCGLQDQHMAVFGGMNLMDFRGKEQLLLTSEEPLAMVEQLAHYSPSIPLIAAHSGVPHDSGKVHRTPRQRWLEGDHDVISRYQAVSQLAARAKRALLAADWPTLGILMTENHRHVAALGGSGPENEHLIDVAMQAGAWGAKLAGAGGGGTILALAEDPEAVGRAMMAAGAEQLIRPAPSPGLTVTEE